MAALFRPHRIAGAAVYRPDYGDLTFAIVMTGLPSAAALGSPTVSFSSGGGSFAVDVPGLASTLAYGTPVVAFTGDYAPDTAMARRLVVTVDPRLQATSLPGSGGPLLQPYPFAPGSHLDIEWDWREWMDQGDALQGFSIDWDGDPIGTLGGDAQGLGVVRTWLTVPGTAAEGARGLLLCTITTFEGRIDSRKYEVIVKQL